MLAQSTSSSKPNYRPMPLARPLSQLPVERIQLTAHASPRLDPPALPVLPGQTSWSGLDSSVLSPLANSSNIHRGSLEPATLTLAALGTHQAGARL
ncbi:uncharacterized protein LOC144581446 isoform X2 [Callithrix jacchus]